MIDDSIDGVRPQLGAVEVTDYSKGAGNRSGGRRLQSMVINPKRKYGASGQQKHPEAFAAHDPDGSGTETDSTTWAVGVRGFGGGQFSKVALVRLTDGIVYSPLCCWRVLAGCRTTLLEDIEAE